MPLRKRTKNIKDISIWKDNPGQYNKTEIVRINFNFPCMWTTLTIYELKELIQQWIIAEERRYPQSNGYKGRALLFNEIKKVFDETEIQ